MLPFEDREFPDYTVRLFNELIPEEELKWHIDEEDRWVSPLGETDWLLQFDNQLPQKLKQTETVHRPKGVYHRVIKGTGNFAIAIRKKPR